MAKYNVSTIAELAEGQEERLKQYPKLASLFYDIEMPLAKVLWQMEQKGILLDTKQLSKVGENIDRLLVSLEKEIDKETGGGVNINCTCAIGYISGR